MIRYLTHTASARCVALSYIATLLLTTATAASAVSYRTAFPAPAFIATTTVDAAGNIYLAGATSTPNLPTTPNAYQSTFAPSICSTSFINHIEYPVYCNHAFVAKLDPTGRQLLFLTYVTGSEDSIGGLVVAPDGSLWLSGRAGSGFPLTAGQEATTGSGFLARLSADGSHLLFSRYLHSGAGPLVADGSGNLYTTGATSGPNFPATPGAFQTTQYLTNQDAWVMKFDPTGAVLWATLLGGTFGDLPRALAVDRAGSVYVAGTTESVPASASLYTGTDYALFPTTPGTYVHYVDRSEAFISKLSADGSQLLYSSVFGGSGFDEIDLLAVDAAGSAWFASNLVSGDFPVTPGAYRTAPANTLAGRLSADGSALVFSTWLISGQQVGLGGMTISAAGDLLLSGIIGSAITGDPYLFPVTADAALPCIPDSDLGFAPFVLAVAPDGRSLPHATFLTGGVLHMEPSGKIYFPGGDSRVVSQVDGLTSATPGPRCLVSAATFRGMAVAPGEIVSLFGSGLGPANGVTGELAAGRLTTSLAGVRVLFGGVPAPLLYASPNQINAVAPFALNPGDSVHVEVQRDGATLPAAFDTTVVSAKPALFTLNGGGGQPYAAAFNQDGSLNTADNPASPGSIVVLYGTGLGRMNPPMSDGEVSPVAESAPAQHVDVIFGSQPGEIAYIGNAPNLVAGAVQINVRVPASATSDTAFVSIHVGDQVNDYGNQIWVR